jgi:endonuclease/exonuclease/phosphatase (EEP) superfamily protein YafD
MKRVIALAPLILCLFCVSCGFSSNYDGASGPVFSGQYSDFPSDFSGAIKVVSYNISFAEHIDLAIQELGELEDADVILLQEMDEASTELVAKSLKYDYVYYPAAVHPRHGKNFGNAILSKWPIRDPDKIILPHTNPLTGQMRIAVKALIAVDGIDVLTYSIHTETPWLSARKRNDQYDTVLDSVGAGYEHVIVGGDFNTFARQSIEELEGRFGGAGLQRASRGTGATARYAGIGFTLDHVFTRGMSVVGVGKLIEAAASDHLPIWVELVPDRGQ